MLPDRIQDKISPEPNSGCWLWDGAASTTGYGQVHWEGKTKHAHRIVFTLLKGEIPAGLDLDHLCRTPMCVNPDHLEPVTRKVNLHRGKTDHWGRHLREKTHCPQGHPYSGENLYTKPEGSRVCRICTREGLRRSRAKKRAGSW